MKVEEVSSAGTRRGKTRPKGDGLLFLEAEAFEDYGGWVLDTQFAGVTGSPYLLAHGLGRPVRDASTVVSFARAGPYRLWVRTLDWTARWNGPGGPGRFRVLVDGEPAPRTFGDEGARWHWRDGGVVTAGAGPRRVALRDLTGFEGRCDALLFSEDLDFVPPDDPKDLARFRRSARGMPEEPEEGGSFDFIVVGGGIAGMCAALCAARSGLKTALIQDRPVVGGNNSSEIRVWLGGEIGFDPYPRIGSLVRELEPRERAHAGPANRAEIYEDDRRLALLREEENLALLLEHRLVGCEVGGGRLTAVLAEHVRTGRRIRLDGRFFADCTGDGDLGAAAGAAFEMTRVGHMGPSNLWHVAETGRDSPFPRCPWALDLADRPFPGRGRWTGQWSRPGLDSLGQWFWESGFSWDPIVEAEAVRDWNFLAMYGAWDALKNVDGLYPTHALRWAAHTAGKRESRRLIGDLVASRRDVRSGRSFPDACFPCTWGLDLHRPADEYRSGFEGREFISHADIEKIDGPWWAPYRCLYSRDVQNLFMAGRDISVTHEALGTVRVMRTCGMMGEVVGIAAALCRRYDETPRGIYERRLDRFREALVEGPPPRRPGG